MELAQADFGSADISLPSPELLSLEQIAKVLTLSSLLAVYANEVAAYAQNMMERGQEVPGFKLVAKKSNRKWNDDAKEASIITAVEMAVGSEKIKDFYEPTKFLSPSKLEKAGGKKVENAIASFWHKPEAGATIASESDKRRALPAPAAMDFLADDPLFQ